MGTLGNLAFHGFGFAFGFFNFVVMTGIAAFRDGAFTKSMSEEEKRELSIAQKKYWNLAAAPLKGFRHEFYILKNGVKLHYVVNGMDEKVKSNNVAIFIHGFPDSYLLWRHLLVSPNLASYTLIAVDLPGYGGSDSLDKCDAEHVLETMTGFILGMREKHLSESGKLTMITHDWGSVVGARLASEAKGLADRWIITAGILPEHWKSNASTRIASSRQMLHTYLRSPLNFRLLQSTFIPLNPIIAQVKRSFYVFILQLPYPIPTFFVRMGNFWFLRLLHWVQAGILSPKGKFTRQLTPSESAYWLCTASGPGAVQFQSPADSTQQEENGYSDSVKRRCADYGMSEKIRYYREGLIFGTWEKSLETVVALSELPVDPHRSGSGAGLFEDGPPGSMKAPITLIYGKQDMAFDPRLALDGISDYLTKGSQVLALNKSGHWLPSEELGAKVIENVAEWALEGEKAPLRERFEGNENVKLIVDRR